MNRRQQIIEAAIERIAEDGIRFSTEDIARDIGCSQSLIFKYFERKGDLIQECFVVVCRKVSVVVSSVVAPAKYDYDSVIGYLMEIWDRFIDYMNDNTVYARAYVFFMAHGFVFPYQGERSEKAVRRILGDSYRPLVDAYPHLDMVFSYLILMANVIALQKSHETREDNVVNRDRLKEIILYGITYRPDLHNN